MSLHNLAQNIASKGRQGDTMLVHMSPEEVGGLQALAMAKGGSLTLNPDTGLPEAFKLRDILPVIAGFALGPAGIGLTLGGLSSAATAGLVTGGATTLATGDLGKGLMAGLGAYGGAGLGEAFAGAPAATPVAPTAPTTPTTPVAPPATATSFADGISQGVATSTAPASGLTGAYDTGIGLDVMNKQPGFVDRYVAAMGSPTKAVMGGLGVAAPFIPQPKGPEAPEPEKSNYKGPYVPSPRSVSFKQPGDVSTSEFTYFTPSNPVPGYQPMYMADGGMIDPDYDMQTGAISSFSDRYADGGQAAASTTAAPTATSAAPAPIGGKGLDMRAAVQPSSIGGKGNRFSANISEALRSSRQAREAKRDEKREDKKDKKDRDDRETPITPTPVAPVQPMPPLSPNEQFLRSLPSAEADVYRNIAGIQQLAGIPSIPGISLARSPSSGASIASMVSSMPTPTPTPVTPSTGEKDYKFQPYSPNPFSGITGGLQFYENTQTSNRNPMTSFLDPSLLTSSFNINNYRPINPTGPINMSNYSYDPRLGGFVKNSPTPFTVLNDVWSSGGGAAGGMMPNDLRPVGGLTALAGGGRFLQGPGDGTSDSIPAVIGNKQPARLADGEFVVDARTVSELGNGSSKAGAQKLYKMMDRVHSARKKAGRGKDSKAEKYLPA